MKQEYALYKSGQFDEDLDVPEGDEPEEEAEEDEEKVDRSRDKFYRMLFLHDKFDPDFV